MAMRQDDFPQTEELEGLQRQLANAEENLRLIQERKSEYVSEEEIPLQLIKNERKLVDRIAELRQRLGLDTLIVGWLHQTRGRTGSERTHHEYASTLSGYRQSLAQASLDLDSEPRACALVLQAYAAARVAERAELGEVGARRRQPAG
jgi:hypothetical protein